MSDIFKPTRNTYLRQTRTVSNGNGSYCFRVESKYFIESTIIQIIEIAEIDNDQSIFAFTKTIKNESLEGPAGVRFLDGRKFQLNSFKEEFNSAAVAQFLKFSQKGVFESENFRGSGIIGFFNKIKK